MNAEPSVFAGIRFVEDTLQRLAGKGTELQRLISTRSVALIRQRGARTPSESLIYRRAVEECGKRISAIYSATGRSWTCPRCDSKLEHGYTIGEGWEYCTNPSCTYDLGFD